ncbi:MAG: hypothetical protein ACD_8C00013G0004 [uncultured bacterium]|nr:MAG: hypothetical protein ACD_8C00013G0004 [uncultured bacterium]
MLLINIIFKCILAISIKYPAEKEGLVTKKSMRDFYSRVEEQKAKFQATKSEVEELKRIIQGSNCDNEVTSNDQGSKKQN